MKKIVIIILLIIPVIATSQIAITIQDINHSKFPLVEAKIKATYNSDQIEVNQRNLLFVEGAIAHRNYTVGPIEAGWQDISWYPDHKYIGEKSYSGSIIMTHEKSTGAAQILIEGIEKKIGTFLFKNFNNEQIHDIRFVNTALGDTTVRAVNCEYFYNLQDELGLINPIRLDSITVDNPNFFVEWRGNQFEKNPPPTLVTFSTHQVLLSFAPFQPGPQSATFSLHYNSGAVVHLRLIGNKKKIEAKTTLEVVEPNGGEVLTPCQDTIIAWKGNVKDIPTKSELSYDNGQTWVSIDSLISDTLNWKVPPVKTSDSAIVRVSQQFTKDVPFTFSISKDVFSVDYSPNSTKALSFSVNSINEWDLTNLSISSLEYNLNSRETRQLPKSVKYISDDKFVALYAVGSRDSIAVFDVGNTNPIQKIGITDFIAEDLYALIDKGEFIVTPGFGNFFRVFDSQSIAVKNDIIFDQPITDIGISNDSSIIAVSGLDSEVLILSKNDYRTQDSITFYRTPIIEKLSLSSDGKLVGLSSVQGANSGRTNTMIWDLESKNIVTSVNISGSTPVDIGFSPTGNMAVFAYQFQNQINIYDLVVGSESGIIEVFPTAMSDLAYSKDNNSFLVASVGNFGTKFKQYFFTFPESDVSDEVFRIVNPIADLKPFAFGDGYIFNETEHSFSTEFCNVGEVPLFIDDAYFRNNVHFTLDNYSLPDTLLPGECIDISINFTPKDTSTVSDSLIIASCSVEYPVYLEGNGLDRTLSFASNPIDFGEVCIGDTSFLTLEIFRNEDPVPFLFNEFESDSNHVFGFSEYSKDTLLQSGETLTATVSASPDKLGEILSGYKVKHSNQDKYTVAATLRVIGIGTFVELSHTTLPFIPEQRTREITIKNIGQDPVEITGLNLFPLTDFQLNTNVPFFIQPGETKSIEVEWIGGDLDVEADLKIDAVPCLTESRIKIIDYNADADITINDTEADPLDTTSISLSYEAIENVPYNGIREFEAIVTIDSKLFIPEYAISEHGEAEIENLGVVNGRREMKLIVNGDFPPSGTLAKIIGYPGLSEDSTSTMLIDVEQSNLWGVSTQVNNSSGLFTLLLTCSDQIINHPNSAIEAISPNPSNSYANVQIYSDTKKYYTLVISNSTGKVVTEERMQLNAGSNVLRLDVSKFDSGNYIISLKDGNTLNSKNMIIIK
ncbi:MAG: T9SS type A sorting domain-containing protein [Chlorobiota bacterium]